MIIEEFESRDGDYFSILMMSVFSAEKIAESGEALRPACQSASFSPSCQPGPSDEKHIRAEPFGDGE